ncbi:MAG: glutamine--tRNA ligase/YqeY domain fusion protein [Chlamydiota bacterium]
MNTSSPSQSKDFIHTIIDEHIRTNKYGGKVITRFPPEPNGYLHIGHAKSICLNFGLAKEYDGRCHLRFDDTDPIKEETEFEESIKETVKWLGYNWGDDLYHASDYFDRFYELAVELIKIGKAYICSLNIDDIRRYRGTVTEPGIDSPYRNRTIKENLDLFNRMKAGEFKDGEHVLRAKIDMSSPNMKMRDPLLYRIRHVSHHMTGNKWCIYPLYDFAHCLSDAIEGITHSICTLEFENNRQLYDWIIDTLNMPHKPRQYEFARLNINYTVMSKRKIMELVNGGYASGWDDPRLLTLAGLRRRGYTPESIRNFCASLGVAKANSVVDIAQLEHAIRDDLNFKAPRVMAVLNPLKVTITNYPEDQEEILEAPYFPEEIPRQEWRPLPFNREIYIEKDDFMENPPKGFFRLAPGREVRLRYAHIIRCDEVIKDEQGNPVELRCSYDTATPLGTNPADGRKIKGIIHWVSAKHAIPTEVRLYDRLFTVENPGSGEHQDFLKYINPQSLITYSEALIEPSVKNAPPEAHYQFERQGYFVADLQETSSQKLVFNRTVPLKDSWGKKIKKNTTPSAETKVKAVKAEKEPTQKTALALTPEQQKFATYYHNELKIPLDYANIIAQSQDLRLYFAEALEAYNNPQGLAKWIINELLRELKEHKTPPINPEHLARLVQHIDQKTISAKVGKEVFQKMIDTNKSPDEIIKAQGLQQISSEEELLPIIEKLFFDYPDILEQINSGRTNRVSFFVGQVMKATGGKANPQLVNKLIMQKLQN